MSECRGKGWCAYRGPWDDMHFEISIDPQYILENGKNIGWDVVDIEVAERCITAAVV